jgi:hypothetical protein
MALTTQQFWQQQLAVHQAAQAAAQSDLAAAQGRQKGAAAQLASDVKSLDTLNAAIARQRAQLATTSIPADANALITQITGQVVQQRHLQGTVLDDQERVDDAQAEVDAAGATLARAATRIAVAQAALAAATAADATRAALKQAIGAPPLATIKADATALLASSTASDAKTRFEADFPAELRELAGRRRATRDGRIASLETQLEHAEDAQASGQAADGGVAGTARQKWIALQRAQDELAYQVATAAGRYARALAVLTTLQAIQNAPAGTVQDVLSDAEKTQLAALQATGAAAAPAADALDDDMKAVFTARDALDAQVLTQIGADVDALATDPTVAAKRAAIVTAEQAFDTALAAFVKRGDLDQWEAAVPDDAWRVVLEYLEGMAALSDLAALDLPGLATGMDNAEDAYTQALGHAEVAQRRADARADAIALRSARLASAQGALQARLASAVRGDSY